MTLSCPFCRNTVFPDETVCPHCGGLLADDPEATAVGHAAYADPYAGYGDADATLVDAAPAQVASRAPVAARRQSAGRPASVGAAGRSASVANAPSRPRQIRRAPTTNSNVMLLVFFAAGAIVLGIFTLRYFSGMGPKPRSFDEPLDRVQEAIPAVQGKIFLFADFPSAGEVRIFYLTQHRLSQAEVDEFVKWIGRSLNRQNLARTVVSDFGNPARYESWRNGGAHVQLILTEKETDIQGYRTVPFQIQGGR